MSQLREALRGEALKLLQGAAHGLRYADLKDALTAQFPGLSRSLFRAVICGLPRDCPQVLRARRGWYIFSPEGVLPGHGPWPRAEEPAFYTSFAAYLGTLERCARCVPVGGSRLGLCTPDVVGRRPTAVGPAQPPVDLIVAGELKAAGGDLMDGFGQACSYKLFAHKSYLAVPEAISMRELELLDDLCQMAGVGLVSFDAERPEEPGYTLRVSARAGQPDMARLNEKLTLLKRELWD